MLSLLFLLKIVIIMYYLKKRRFFAYCPKVTLVGTGFEPGTFEFPTYQSNYLTRPTISAIPTTCVYPRF